MANFGIAMKIQFHPDVQLKAEYFCKKSFAVLIPNNCTTVEDVKLFLASEFCANALTFLDLCVDSVFALSDRDSIQVIQFYSNKDKVFECTLNIHAICAMTTSCSTCSSSIVSKPFRSSSRPNLDDIGSWIGTESASSSFLKPKITKRVQTPKRPAEESEQVEEMDVPDDHDHTNMGTKSFPESVQGAPKKVDFQNRSANETPDIPENSGQPTRSAKRRERLRRSVVKRLCLTPGGQPTDTEGQNKENEAGDGETPGEETPIGPKTPEMSGSTSPNRRILRSATRRLKNRSDFYREGKFRFVSEILQNQATPETTSVQAAPIDYDNLPMIDRIDDIKLNDLMAFKVWELGADGPCMSAEYKEVRVVGIDRATGRLMFEYIKGAPEVDAGLEGYIADDTLGCSTNMDFQRLLQPRRLGQDRMAETDYSIADLD